jgi:hypothetical protein
MDVSLHPEIIIDINEKIHHFKNRCRLIKFND